MHSIRRSSRTVRSGLLLGLPLAMSVAVLGCRGPSAPPPPPGGGVTAQLDYARFVSDVEPVLVAHGCDAAGDCHGGGIRGTYELSPPDAKSATFDFNQTVLQVSAAHPDSSRILTQPLALAAGGTPHAVKIFASTSDSSYQAIRNWILAGVTK